jgi:chromosome segregation ATPase
VSTWLAYADGVREHVDAAIQCQVAQPACDGRAGLTAGSGSLATDLQLAREQIELLRAERDKLRDHIRDRLGEQPGQISSKTARRADRRTHHHQASTANRKLQARVDELEENLAAARTSLRRVLKETNRTGPPADPAS